MYKEENNQETVNVIITNELPIVLHLLLLEEKKNLVLRDIQSLLHYRKNMLSEEG